MLEGESGPEVTHVIAWALAVKEGLAGEVMGTVIKEANSQDASVLVLDGDMVFGSDHLASALYHASKAIQEDRNASDSLQMETLLYASGERQLSSAIKKMSVSDSTTVVVAVLVSESEFHPGEGWTEVPRRAGPLDSERLRRFGIGLEEASTIDPSDLADLVLERVANVDLIKK
jgi:KEOPS complex subunit Cgi121